MSDYLKDQSSKIITIGYEKDTAGYILMHAKQMAVIISNDRYERLLKRGIDINEYYIPQSQRNGDE